MLLELSFHNYQFLLDDSLNVPTTVNHLAWITHFDWYSLCLCTHLLERPQLLRSTYYFHCCTILLEFIYRQLHWTNFWFQQVKDDLFSSYMSSLYFHKSPFFHCKILKVYHIWGLYLILYTILLFFFTEEYIHIIRDIQQDRKHHKINEVLS